MQTRTAVFAAAMCSACFTTSAIAAPWIMHHGLTDAEYQDFYNDELPAGYRPYALNVHGTGSSERFAGVWIADGITNWIAHHDMDGDLYQILATDYDILDYRIVSVDAAGEFPNEEYVAAWVSDGTSDADWGAVHRQTSAQMTTVMNNYLGNGFRPISLSGTGTGSNARFAAAFERNTEGWSYDVVWDLSESDYQEYVEDNARVGFRVHSMTAYGDPSDTRLGAIFVRTDGPNWERGKAWFSRHNRTGVEHQDDADSATGYFTPTSVVQYGSSGAPEFGSAWFEDTPDPVLTITGQQQPTLAAFDLVMADFMESRQFQRGSLAVTKDGRLVYNRAFTYDYPDQWLTQPGHRFRVASVSKPITAVAVLKAVDMGLFDLDDTLDEIPGFDASGWLAADDVPGNVTIDMLLKHQGGWDRDLDPMLDDVGIADSLGVSLPIDLDDIIENTKDQALESAPGTAYEYSNFGYALLGRVIELTSGQSYEEFVRENVLCPLGAEGMQQANTRLEDLHPGEVNYTDPMYRLFPSVMDDDRTYDLYPYARYNVENMDAHGGWVATAEELARFVSDFTTDTGSTLLTSDQIDYMFDENSQTGSYGAGWQRAGSTRFHNGSLRGTWAYIIRRNDGVTMSVLFNGRSNGVNTPIADNDSTIYTNLMAAAQAVEDASSSTDPTRPRVGWPSGDLFGPNECAALACPADITGDGFVDSADLARLIAIWGAQIRTGTLDGDNVIGAGDLAVLLASWGPCP